MLLWYIHTACWWQPSNTVHVVLRHSGNVIVMEYCDHTDLLFGMHMTLNMYSCLMDGTCSKWLVRPFGRLPLDIPSIESVRSKGSTHGKH